MMKVNNAETPIEINDSPLSTTSNNETDTTCWTIKLPPKLNINSNNDNKLIIQDEVNYEEQSVKTVESSTPETPPTVTMTISSTNPADFARRRRIKRRSTGIEDDRGLIVSPDMILDSTNPFSSNETVDAAFDVILRVCMLSDFNLFFNFASIAFSSILASLSIAIASSYL